MHVVKKCLYILVKRAEFVWEICIKNYPMSNKFQEHLNNVLRQCMELDNLQNVFIIERF